MRGRLCAADHRPRSDPLRPAVRALPQPESHLDARHRHGLRLPLPGRDDPLRRRALRPRPRRPDHHVRHDQGPQRGARRGARARLPVQRRRPHRQGDAAARDGPRHTAQVLLRGAPEVRRRVQGGHRAARHVRRRSRRQEGRRRRQGVGEPEAVRRHPRRRRRHHQGAAHRVPAGAAQAGARPAPGAGASRHAVRDARRRGARSAEDGLPRPAQPRRDHRHGRDAARRQGTRLRHRHHPARRRADLGAAPARCRDRCVPAGGRAAAGVDEVTEAVQLRRRRRPARALSTGADGGEHAQRLRRPQERPQADPLRARRPRRGARRHLRPDDLPGVDDAGGPEGRRLLARRGRQPAQSLSPGRHKAPHPSSRLRPDRTRDAAHGPQRPDDRHGGGHDALRDGCRRVAGRAQASAALDDRDRSPDRSDRRTSAARRRPLDRTP